MTEHPPPLIHEIQRKTKPIILASIPATTGKMFLPYQTFNAFRRDPDDFDYSEIIDIGDPVFQYRLVEMPFELVEVLPLRNFLEIEWREFGIQMSPGWINFHRSVTEPHVLWFRRLKPEFEQNELNRFMIEEVQFHLSKHDEEPRETEFVILCLPLNIFENPVLPAELQPFRDTEILPFEHKLIHKVIWEVQKAIVSDPALCNVFRFTRIEWNSLNV
jgi:cyclin-dependent kinase regulatory subunit CKS1